MMMERKPEDLAQTPQPNIPEIKKLLISIKHKIIYFLSFTKTYFSAFSEDLTKEVL
jgi:hypothetical protein